MRHLKELGLSPRWVLRQPATTDTTAISAPPPQDEIQTTDKTAPPPRPVVASPSPPASEKISEADIMKMNWLSLEKTVSACKKCVLCETRQNTVFGCGDRMARIFFIGEGPGGEEDRKGEPFVGRAGKLLDKMLSAIDLSRQNGVYIANIVKCRPPNNRAPAAAESSACVPYLHRQLQLAKPSLIVALGGVAAAHLLQTTESVGKLRGRMHDYRDIPLIVTYHPAYLLRKPSDKRKSWEDFCMIARMIAEN